ncbi:hypothetical protein BDQ12DRAFT_691572 [Crucibulum laeve]|uniref:F-box domain-containing protein n=1 Tax=Crucibulum laeve TaxID=68775 RepID=A0A5C3LKI3_9AGAR|nr:hypothetical protein BDQ12DRAFT_691572 [Crucibulum laeve]
MTPNECQDLAYPALRPVSRYRICEINLLPPEILTEIFIRCLPSGSVRPRYRDAPLLLCRVCKHWNMVATDIPFLWAAIAIRFDLDEEHHGEQANPIRTWLSLSRDYPLDISVIIQWEEWVERKRRRLFIDTFKLLVSVFSRWRTVEITLPNCISSSYCQFPPGGAPLLESAHIHVTSGSSAGSSDPFACAWICKGSDKLRSFAWQMRSSPIPPIINESNLAMLHDLHLECSLSQSQCLQLLERCPLLQTCHFDNVMQSSWDDIFPPQPLIYSSLHSFRVDAQSSVSEILKSLTLPSLKSLVVSLAINAGEAQDFQLSELHPLISRSKPPLEKLTLDNFPISELELVQCLVMTSSLVALELNDDNRRSPLLTDIIIVALSGGTRDREGAFICPKLEVLKLTGNVSSTDRNFSKMVQLRWERAAAANQVACLQKVHVEFADEWHQEDVAVLTELRSQGLTLRVFMRQD